MPAPLPGIPSPAAGPRRRAQGSTTRHGSRRRRAAKMPDPHLPRQAPHPLVLPSLSNVRLSVLHRMLARDGECDHGTMAIANITIVRVATTRDAPRASSSRPSPAPLTPPRPTSCARVLTAPGDSTLPFRHATLGPDLTSAARRAARTHAVSELLGLPLCRGHRGCVRPRLHRGRALRRRAALSSNGLVRTCAVATFWPPDRKEATSDFSEAASDLLLLPSG